jgi:ATP-binding cassette, subfamily C (CFTR/MRP), member 1
LLQAAILAEQSSLHRLTTSASLPSSLLSVVAAIVICILSHYEHTRSHRPSYLLWSYLCINALFEATRTRTYWLVGDNVTAACFTAAIAVNLLLLALEGRNKQSLAKDLDQNQSAEELAGPLSRSLFYWLIPLMLNGYKRLLTTSDLSPIDSTLCSAKLRPRFYSIVNGIQGFSQNGLALTTIKCLGWKAFAPVIPRLSVSAFTMAQPFLITSVLDYLQSPTYLPKEHGYGLIGACALTYIGIAVSFFLPSPKPSTKHALLIF